MFKKRFFAFIIDLIIVFLITFVIDMIIPISDNAQKLSEELFDLNNNFIDGNIGIDMFINQYSIINYGLEKELFLSSLISVVVNILYFVLYPLYNGGQSFGKKYIGIKIVSKDDNTVSSNQLIFRYLLMNGIGSSIISLCFIFLLNAELKQTICINIINFTIYSSNF